MSSRQTDNSRFAEKCNLRKPFVKNGIYVLDCYHGEGYIWDNLKKDTDVKVFGIEKEKGKGSGAIYGLSEKVIPGLDLSMFDLIDCDAYGSPKTVLDAIFENKTKKPGTVIFYTFIQTGMGGVENALLKKIGINKSMISRCPTLFKDLAFPAFKQYLYSNGVGETSYYYFNDGPSNKWYGYFVLTE